LIVDIELFVIATCPRERYFGARGARDAPLSSQGICVSEVTLVILDRVRDRPFLSLSQDISICHWLNSG